MLGYEVLLYEEGGKYPVQDFLRGLPKGVKEKADKWIALLHEKGNEMPSKYCSKLTGSPLWELKIDYRRNEYRVFYFFSGKFIILVNGFIKKTNHTPPSEINLGERRMRTWQEGRGQ